MMRSSKKKKGLQPSLKKNSRFSSTGSDYDDDDELAGSSSKGFLGSMLRSKSSGYSSNDDGAHESSRGGKGGRRHRSVSPKRSTDRPAVKASVSFDDDAVTAPTPDASGASPYANSYERPDYANSYERPTPNSKKKDQEKVRKSRTVADTRKHRVRPYRCFSEPTYMTEDEIYKDMMKPSSSAVFLKSHFPPSTSKIPGEVKISDAVRNLYDSPEVDGRIGSIRVEVLGCVGLARQKPYVAIYVVSGDSAFCTDVLNNFRSPMWPSNSTRAAVFPVHHAYARVFIGVFDVRARQGKENDVFCGRVTIDIACIRPNTEYDVTFPLRASSFVYDRRKRGVIRVRFSLHWFSERAAICSYLKSSRWFSASEPAKGLGQPTIPCAEPKTFRNVAVTCHGQDFPGKYTRLAFRATMREFNLYHLNVRFMMKTLVLDALLYERPHISLYLFLAFQHCIFSNIVRMVPPYASGYIILLFLDNYMWFNVSERFNLGYKPLSVFELFMGLIKDGNGDKPQMRPQLIKKRAKKVVDKRSKKKGEASATPTTTESFFSAFTGGNKADEDGDDGVEVVPRDHREFPFSERDEYPRFSVQEALAPSTKPPTKGEEGNTRMQGRLSIYFVKEESKQDVKEEVEEEKEGEDEDSGQESEDEAEDETIASAADSQVGDVDVFDMDFEPEEEEMRQSGGLFDSGTSRIKRARVRVGPPQNCDISPRKKTPPQQTLQKIEKQMHKLSRGIALERVITVPGARKYGPDATETDASGKKKGKSKEDLLTKSTHYDDFDKILGLQSKYTNPVLRITSSFLGPLMRMIRIFLYITRVAFNLTTWRDPYLSFWVLVVLSTQTFVLLIWPWRPFLFISSFLCLGPQNIFVRKYLEKKAAEKAQAVREKKNDKEPADATASTEKGSAATDYMNSTASSSKQVEVNMDQFGGSGKGKNKSRLSGLLSKTFRSKRSDSGSQTDDESVGGADDVGGETQEQRPAFSTQHNSRSSKKLRPREVAVPYSKLRKDRFYDWPPDPTTARANPVPIGPWADINLEEMAGTGAPPSKPSKAAQPTAQPMPQANGDDVLENLRRRYVAEQQKSGEGNGGEYTMSPW